MHKITITIMRVLFFFFGGCGFGNSWLTAGEGGGVGAGVCWAGCSVGADACWGGCGVGCCAGGVGVEKMLLFSCSFIKIPLTLCIYNNRF